MSWLRFLGVALVGCSTALTVSGCAANEEESEAGGDALSTYTFGTHVAQHRFCRTCGIHPFYTPRSHPDQVDVNVRCLDDDAWTSSATVPFDGRSWV